MTLRTIQAISQASSTRQDELTAEMSVSLKGSVNMLVGRTLDSRTFSSLLDVSAEIGRQQRYSASRVHRQAAGNVHA